MAPPAMSAAVVVITRLNVPAIPAAAPVGSSMEPGAAASGDESDVRLRPDIDAIGIA